ncbi:acyl-CoA dehydrogenase family protein [Bacillus piscicola]|uniref:acyl-CoA dehydrogenase family protein n=1 Tax=Bacillus piscicola TaxID=1632684 RepID=UPI001F0906CE|nr:acyl-CoA dehydrogenase family protein [Bacillus piscicola]
MEFRLTDEQEQLREKVRQFAEKHIRPAVKRMEAEDRFPQEVVLKMAESKWMGIPVPSQYGGSGMDFLSYVLAIEEISKVSPALGVILAVHTSVGTNPILAFGTDEQKEKYATKLASGEYLGAFALTEANAGSDAGALQTTAVKENDHYRLHGTKMFITNGGAADTYILFASTDPSKGSRGITAFIVEKGLPGLQVGKKEQKMGLRGSNTTSIILEDCVVPVENRLGKEGEGFKIALANLGAGRIGIAAQALGIAKGALAAAWQAQQKEGDSGKLADMAVQIEAAQLLTYQAACLHQQNLPCTKQASMAKLFASRTAMNVATEAVQVIGEAGTTTRYPAERFFRDAKVCEIYEGTSEIQRVVIGKHLIGDSREKKENA